MIILSENLIATNEDNLVGLILAHYGLRLCDLCRMSGIPYRTLQDWYGGRREPPLYVLRLLCFYLDNASARPPEPV